MMSFLLLTLLNFNVIGYGISVMYIYTCMNFLFLVFPSSLKNLQDANMSSKRIVAFLNLPDKDKDVAVHKVQLNKDMSKKL